MQLIVMFAMFAIFNKIIYFNVWFRRIKSI